MAVVKKGLMIVGALAFAYFAPYLAPQIGAWFGATGFLANAIGSTILAAGMYAIQSVLISRPQAPTVEAGKVNVRIPEPPRWIDAGEVMQGGGVLFADFDSAGNLWYLVVHSDSILVNRKSVLLDNVAVTLDASGNVTSNDFCLNNKREAYTGTGTKVTYIQIWTTTYTAGNPVPSRIAALDAAFPSKWTADHRLAGTTFSVIKMKALPAEDRYKIYKWRGPLGLGEPSISIVGEWSLPFDPRTGLNAYTTNPALIWAWFRTHRYGRNKPANSINWDRVAEQANICDQNVTGVYGTQKRYECSTAIPEGKERHIAEQEIMASCDGQLVFDDDGKAWIRVGHYQAPTLSLSRNRDIVAMESVEAQNGESETQGVIVRYIDPAANYTAQPSAPWYNPLYYVPGQSFNPLVVDVLTCQNHNQAMRLAKGIGMRSQPSHKIVPTIGLRGLRARKERFVNITYDNTFAGEYEIVTPVEVDEAGMFCGFGAVPVSPDRWTLLPGEEKAKPVTSDVPTAAPVLTMPSGVTVAIVNGRIEAQFGAAARDDVRFEFQHIATVNLASDRWSDMVVVMDSGFAYSVAIDTTLEQKVRWRTVSTGGRTSEWVTIPATVPASPPYAGEVIFDGGNAAGVLA